MPEYLSPAIYVEEVSGGIKPIEGVGTSTGAFIGIAEKGPIVGMQYEDGVGRPVLITNFGDFRRAFGSFRNGEFLAYAVQQFFGEGGTRCYVARTAHFANPADPTTLTARRASVPLVGGVSTTLAATLSAGATQAQLASVTGIQTGMALFINDGNNSARVSVTGLPGGNAVDFDPAIPAGTTINNGAAVNQVVLNVNAINEGEWGNNLRVSVAVSGRISTTLDMPGDPGATPPIPAGLQPGAHQAVLASLSGIRVGTTLFIADATNAAQIQVTRIEEALRRITFRTLAPAATPAISNGAGVTGTTAGKASTVLNGAVASGATEAVLHSTEGITEGSILLFVSENLGDPSAAPPVAPSVVESRAVVSRVVGKRVFFMAPGLTAGFPDGTSVTTEDFTLTVYDGDDVVETHSNLCMEDSNITDFAENRINLGATRSQYVRVQEAGSQALALAQNVPPARTDLPVRLGSFAATEGVDGGDDGEGDYLGDEAAQTGFHAFDSVDDINIVAAPGITFRSVILAGMTYCENRKDCFFVGDVPQIETVTGVLDFKNGTGSHAGSQALNSKYGALYWPWIRIFDPLTSRPMAMAPSGAVIGTFSATDVRRGVHKAPAGIDDGFLNTVIGIEKVVTKGEHDLLNPQGINVIRSLTDAGIVIWGARTTSSDPEWRYTNVRRLFIFLEESIQKGTQWVVFEPNDPALWKSIVRNVSAFLRIQWLEGKLVGNTPEEAFFVKCDKETNPQESIDLGRVITEIGVAPSKPAEFVIFRIAQWAGGAEVSE
jgi:phage tail sheath protein FI